MTDYHDYDLLKNNKNKNQIRVGNEHTGTSLLPDKYSKTSRLDCAKLLNKWKLRVHLDTEQLLCDRKTNQMLLWGHFGWIETDKRGIIDWPSNGCPSRHSMVHAYLYCISSTIFTLWKKIWRYLFLFVIRQLWGSNLCPRLRTFRWR